MFIYDGLKDFLTSEDMDVTVEDCSFDYEYGSIHGRHGGLAVTEVWAADGGGTVEFEEVPVGDLAYTPWDEQDHDVTLPITFPIVVARDYDGLEYDALYHVTLTAVTEVGDTHYTLTGYYTVEGLA